MIRKLSWLISTTSWLIFSEIPPEFINVPDGEQSPRKERAFHRNCANSFHFCFSTSCGLCNSVRCANFTASLGNR
ncbi:hypothetical protein C8F04DRAFT_1119186 [Mycena alexandri]|uniref:Secreted protein n=1 Tax=Mycena alexandri TaxID=1745969 RepID=A0AAD6WX24_9AGAR|nr:hypothetical protein C8F04DRAFT_1119186 [Mycena alexandri]